MLIVPYLSGPECCIAVLVVQQFCKFLTEYKLLLLSSVRYLCDVITAV